MCIYIYIYSIYIYSVCVCIYIYIYILLVERGFIGLLVLSLDTHTSMWI